MNPAIVIAAYDRPRSLARLLRSVGMGKYPDNVPLLISIDFGGSRREEILQIAGGFNWKFGDKLIIKHKSHLGVTGHFRFAGSLSEKYGSVIRLEDDQYVSPVFYNYAAAAIDSYMSDQRVAGLSLYNVTFNGVTREEFIPYPDEGDVYFMQTPWSHGQVFLASQWEKYLVWEKQFDPAFWTGALHERWTRLDDDEWFATWAKYLVDTDRYFVFPRESFCTNFGDPGAHFNKGSRFFQVPLQTRRREFKFPKFEDCVAVYDAFQEILPDRLARLVRDFDIYDFEVDLNGTKPAAGIKRTYVITSQPCFSPVRKWGLSLYPREANIAESIPGKELKLCRREDIVSGWLPDLITRSTGFKYSRVRSGFGLGMHLLYWLSSRLEGALTWLIGRGVSRSKKQGR